MERVDVAIIGAGAAGFMTAIAAGRRHPGLRIALLDGARTPGAKILVSGGSRCNVTNARITAADYNGGRPGAVRRVLRAFDSAGTVAFFAAAGVPLHEEERGKLFPDSGRSRDVLDALVAAAAAAGAPARGSRRVHSITRGAGGFVLDTVQGPLAAPLAVLATGGLALPKSGSDGAGYGMAQRLGHGLVPTTPALVPLCLGSSGATRAFWEELRGVSSPAALRVSVGGKTLAEAEGPLLWTHFGVSGPAALDISRHWLRADLESSQSPALSLGLLPGSSFESLEAACLDAAKRNPRSSVQTWLAQRLPGSLASACLRQAGVAGETQLASWTREQRRALVHLLIAWRLPVTGSRGYTYAEVTAGGVPLDEVDPRTMESRRCPGLYLVGEILDVDGRLGGFNFQWAWASGFVAGSAIAARVRAAAR